VKIREIRAVGLRGATPEGGWTEEIKPEDSVHTLIAVLADEDVVGLGSVFNNVAVVRACLEQLKSLYQDENALEPERVSEKLRQHMFWFGRGGSVTHTISGIDIALWDLLGKVTGQPIGRLLGGRYRGRVKPYPGGDSAGVKGEGFPGVQDRMGTLWAPQRRVRRGDCEGSSRGRGSGFSLDGRCRRKRCLLEARL
jgi:L-alanine-DL-glutamate epimerase-like enolase superfamily enzyme